MSNAAPKSDLSLSHRRVTGLSGNEIFCLRQLGMRPGNLCIGNSVFSIGVAGGIMSGIKNLAGGEIEQITTLIHDGRTKAIERMLNEAVVNQSSGVAGVTTEIMNQGGNIEFLSVGSAVHDPSSETTRASSKPFTSSADAQELYCQIDAGFKPIQFAFGNVAYSIGVGGGIGGFFRSMKRGEVPQFSEIFDRTRHLALERISNEAKKCGANAVVGIETTITPMMGAQEMLMIGTASYHPLLTQYTDHPVTSDMTSQEMWNLANLGFLPIRLVMGVSVYSMGVGGNIMSSLQGMARGEINSMTSLLYEARERALMRIERDAEQWQADEVVGVKTHVYDLGGGMIEFLAIGTAVRKIEGACTRTTQMPVQAIIQDRDTYFEAAMGVDVVGSGGAGRKMASGGKTLGGPFQIVIGFFAFLFLIAKILLSFHH